MNVFVNVAVTNGINAYIAKISNKSYPLAHVFELRIIEFLVVLYGKINILNPYKLMSESSLKNNLMVYGASIDKINELFELLDEYNSWLSSNSREKNTIIKDIFEILSYLVILKNKSVLITSDEMKYYESFFALNDVKINQIVDMSAVNKDDVINTWLRAVEESKKVPAPEEPLYLNDDEYEKWGLFIDEVKALPKDKVLELNKEIQTRNENESANGGNTKDKPWQLVLSSGNGYVDALVLFSIMCTEIMMGIIITVVIGRF